jgi:hypothetical protein
VEGEQSSGDQCAAEVPAGGAGIDLWQLAGLRRAQARSYLTAGATAAQYRLIVDVLLERSSTP